MAKRSNGEGSLRKRPDGRWCAQIQVGTDENGKKIIKSLYGKKREEAVQKLRAYQLTTSQGYNFLKAVTLKDYATNWLNAVKQQELKPTSFDRLDSMLTNHVIPAIGNYKITELTSLIIQEELINKMKVDNLSYSSIKKAYDMVNACLKYAVRNRQLIFNPMETVAKPSTTKFKAKDIAILTDGEIKKFLDASNALYSNGKRKYPMGQGLVLILYTGLRMGEALALKWSDVDLENKTAKITNALVVTKNRNPKMKDDDKKRIVLDQDTNKVNRSRIIHLNEKAIQALIEIKNLSRNSEYVLCSKDGKPIWPRHLQNTLDSITERAGLNHYGTHALRHTFASMLFKNNVPIKVISDILGHADVRTTYNTYVHLIDEQKIDAMKILDGLNWD